MNKILLLLFSLFVFQDFVAQKKDTWLEFYDQGKIELAKTNYRTADSLFSLSLKISPNSSSYFSRAECRIKLNDLNGYCKDIGNAALYRDKGAIEIYYKECCKVDTIVSLKEGTRTIELITKYKYNDNTDYEKYDGDTTLLVSYYTNNKDTIYKSGQKLTSSWYGENDSLLIDYIEKTKFTEWTMANGYTGKVSFSVITDEAGKASDIKIVQSSTSEYEVELLKELSVLPNSSPAKISGKYVKCQKNVSVIFAKKLLYASTSALETKKLSKKGATSQKQSDTTLKEVMPEYPGGVSELMRFIQKNLEYPKVAIKSELSGKCFLRFVVSRQGLIRNVNIIRGVPGCIECDVEATRVLYAMPKWSPGMQNNKAVNVFFNLPINFQLR